MTTNEKPMAITFVESRQTLATQDYVYRVRRELGIEDVELAQRIADFVVAEVEHYGAEGAVLYFGDDGTRPWCSWCHSIAGLCSHIMHNGGKDGK